MKEVGSWESFKDMENILSQMVLTMKDISWQVKNKAKEPIFIAMGQNMRVNGKTTSNMAKESTLTKLETSMRGNGRMEKEQVMVNAFLPTKMFMKETGKMTNSTGSGLTLISVTRNKYKINKTISKNIPSIRKATLDLGKTDLSTVKVCTFIKTE